MPRPGPLRPQVAVRLSEQGIAVLDALALAEGLVKGNGQPNRSEMIRVLLGDAVVCPRCAKTRHARKQSEETP